MGFLSRKSKQADTAVKEQDGIVEELQEMEEAVPETHGADSAEPRPAGPVVGEGTSSSRDDAPGEAGTFVTVLLWEEASLRRA